MAVYQLDPLHDPRWSALVAGHPAGSVFHGRGWLDALKRTYEYQPIVYTTCPPDTDLTNGIALCRVVSWLTGRRMVSVPFADHCEPLAARPEDQAEIVAALREEVARGWGYVELRPGTNIPEMAGFDPAASFMLHTLDLRPSIDELFNNTHPNMIQRKIRRAGREGLSIEEGRSEALLERFCRLMLLTRRRHGLPPQPIEWFRNLATCHGERLKIRVAVSDGRPIAGILTLKHGHTMVYKYGCSDATYHRAGPVPFLLWSAILEAKAEGMTALDLGRSDLGAEGLIAFKNRWGARATTMTYLRHSRRPPRTHGGGISRAARAILARMPDAMLTLAGRLVYRHLG